MIIYNVTINVESDIHSDWLSWMKNKHIPDVMSTGLFLGNRFCKILSTQEGESGHTYSVQYDCSSMDTLNEYQEKHAQKLQKEHLNRYEGKFVAFRTLLETV